METLQSPFTPKTLLPEEEKKTFPKLPILMIVIALIFLGGGFSWGYLIGTQSAYKDTATPALISPTTTPIGDICKKYGVLEPSEFLTAYTVQKGDTPSSIVTKELGDTTRVDEFLVLNKRYNPNLVASTSTQLAPNSKLYLPPKEIKTSSGSLYGKAGMYVRTEDKYYWIRTRTENSESGDTPLYLATNTLFVDKIEPGDCIISINDTYSPILDHQALIIKKAEKAK